VPRSNFKSSHNQKRVPPANSEKTLKRKISWEAARILVEGSSKNFLAAKKKALTHLNLPANTSLPRNIEVEKALRQQLAIFDRQNQEFLVNKARQQAIELMRFLGAYNPRLVGHVLEGIFLPTSSIQLHLFSDTAEEVVFFLEEHNIPFKINQIKLRFGKDEYKELSVLSFVVDQFNTELYIFMSGIPQEAPLNQVTGKPMKRASLGALESLISQPPE